MRQLVRWLCVVSMGWYLMMPPRSMVEQAREEPDGMAPLHMWTEVRGYDTAAECEAVLEKIERGETPGDEHWKPILERVKREMRCVSSDDPRLR